MLMPSNSNLFNNPTAPYWVAHKSMILSDKFSVLLALSSTAFVSFSVASVFCSIADLSLPITFSTCSALNPASCNSFESCSVFSIKLSPNSDKSLSPSISFCTHASKASSSERFSVSSCSFSSDAKNSLNSGMSLTCSVALFAASSSA